MYTSHSILSRTSSRNQDHVLRIVGTFRSGAAQVLAAQERHEAALAFAAHMHMAREAGVAPAGIGSLLASLRRLTGGALIRFGQRLHGRPVAAPASSPVTAA